MSDLSLSIPLVTVVVPVHNGARFLGECLQSVFDQTHPRIECVVVDDGSSDDTAVVLDGFRDRIRVIRQERRGPAAARNAGAAAATGSVLAFLDADDLWLPGKLTTQLDVMKTVPGCSLVYTGYWVSREGRPARAIFATDPAARIRAQLLLEGPGLASSSTVMVTRCAFEAVGGYDERLRAWEDVDLFSRVTKRFVSAAVPEPLAVYRRHASQSHLCLELFERNASIVGKRWPENGMGIASSRLRANIESYLFWRSVLARRRREARKYLVRAWKTDPTRLVVLPVRRLPLRIATGLFRRWPLRVQKHPVVSVPDHPIESPRRSSEPIANTFAS